MKYKKYRRKFEMPQEIDNIAVSVGKVCWQPSTNPNNLLLIGEVHVVFYMLGAWSYPYTS
jgi:hypothetical protein